MNKPRQFSYLEQVGEHEKRIRGAVDQFTLCSSVEPLDEPVTVMLFTNRSGSSLVAEHLRATGQFRGFGEPLNARWVLSMLEMHGIRNFSDFMRFLYENEASEQTLFGLKASVQQALMLLRANVIPNYFADVRWVLARRSDLVDQAVSLDVAGQTGRWTSYAEGVASEPVYDFEGIRQRLRALSAQKAAIETFFAVYEIEPYLVDYEDFCADPAGETGRLAAYLGKDNVQVDRSLLRRQKQGDDTSSEFRERFVDDYQDWLLSAPRV